MSKEKLLLIGAGDLARIGGNCTVCSHATVPEGADIPDCTAFHGEANG